MASRNSSAAANGKSAVIKSGHGADLLIGTAAADVFHIGSVEASSKAAQDTVEGFGPGDLVSFDGIALQGANAPATLHWAGIEPDSGKAYGVWQWADGTLRADINGDSAADISVDMQGVLLGAGDFQFGAGHSIPGQPVEPEIPAEPETPVRPGNSDLPATQLSWVESFDNGLGLFSRSWGPGVDTSVPGQLTIWTSADDHDSGAMVPPWGNPDAGFGYGLYSFTLETQGKIGIYALTWPATDVWPGPELDLLEIDPSGNGYSAIHYKAEDGGNGFQTYGWGQTDLSEVHTFSMLWEEGRLTGFIDGEERWTTTENVPRDYAHGGENTAPGIGTQTWWNDGAMGGRNSITLYEASYSVIA